MIVKRGASTRQSNFGDTETDGDMNQSFQELTVEVRDKNGFTDVETVGRDQAASILGVNTRTLHRWNRAGYGPKRRPSLRRFVSYTRSEVEDWAAKRAARECS